MARGHDQDEGSNDDTTTANRDPTDRQTGDWTPFDRRSYLKLAGAAAAGTALSTSSAAGATTVDGITFDRVVHAVDDLGLDPNGNQDIKNTLQDQPAGTLVDFPDGEYLITPMAGMRSGNMGCRGIGDNVRFRPADGTNQFIINTTGANKFLFKNIDIDQRAKNTLAGFKLVTDNGWHVEDVEFLGRGAIEDRDRYNDEGEQEMFIAHVGNRDAVGLFRNVVSKQISMVNDAYPSNGSISKGRVGCYAGGGHYGIVRFENCDFREARNNALYMSRHPGDVQVVDCYFENNNVSSIRISGPRSYAKNTKVVVDASKLSDGAIGPNRESTNFRGFICEQARYGSKGSADNPTVIDNCEFVYKALPDNVNAGGIVNLGPAGRNLLVKNTTIHTDVAGTPALKRRSPGAISGGGDRVADKPHWLRVDGVTVTGSAANGTTVYIKDADGSYVRNCCIEQSGSGRDGVTLYSSDACDISDSNINVTGTAIDLNGSNATTSNITSDETCSTSSGGDGSSGSDGDSGSTLENLLTIFGDQGLAEYEFTVSGDLEKSTENGASINSNDVVDGSTATGQVNGGKDSYRFSGEITAFSLSAPATVTLNGTEVDPATLGSDSSTSSNVLTIFGDQGSAEYDLRVTDSLQKSTANGATIDSNDVLDGTTASGQVNGGKDSYEFTGEILDFDLSAPATVTLNGTEVDPATLGGNLPHVLIVDGTDGTATSYKVAVSGDLASGPRADADDEVSGDTVTGAVDGGVDDFWFSGGVRKLYLDGTADLVLDE